ncbi:MAG: hypothetical protein CVV08_11000 [Gammaproteobacteria bacterium HGW-Gammaproteobacteria-12]|nr:MAG: hypothetical protein CVV08_11000 [Gammaproteobacteria bacterium HGW-Gammaproteobacteria-12]
MTLSRLRERVPEGRERASLMPLYGNSEIAVIPAQAGIQNLRSPWAPAFAGVTINGFFRTSLSQ